MDPLVFEVKLDCSTSWAALWSTESLVMSLEKMCHVELPRNFTPGPGKIPGPIVPFGKSKLLGLGVV
jgi:hypothetical protein